jgi:P27 family predicted phage terminase small subunit
MARGRKPIPEPLKLVKGTSRVDRINPAAPAPARDGICAPDMLPEAARPHFEILTARLRGLGLDSSSYTEAVTMAAVRMAELEYCNGVIEANGGPSYETHTIQGGRMVRAYPEVAMRSEAMRHLHSLLSELGLTPSAIGKVGAKEPEKAKTKFGGFNRG